MAPTPKEHEDRTLNDDAYKKLPYHRLVDVMTINMGEKLLCFRDHVATDPSDDWSGIIFVVVGADIRGKRRTIIVEYEMNGVRNNTNTFDDSKISGLDGEDKLLFVPLKFIPKEDLFHAELSGDYTDISEKLDACFNEYHKEH